MTNAIARLIRVAVSWSLYWVGDVVSRLLNWGCDLRGMPEWSVDLTYRAYSRLMLWSVAADPGEYVWMSRREGETEESFRARCAARWPEQHCQDDLIP